MRNINRYNFVSIYIYRVKLLKNIGRTRRDKTGQTCLGGDNVSFYEFINIMYEVLGNNKADFVIELLDMFTSYEKDECGSYHDLDRSSLRKILSGKRNINSLKAELIDHLDEPKFENIVSEYTVEKRNIIINAFRRHGKNIDLCNLEESLYQMFVSSLSYSTSNQHFISEELMQSFMAECNGKCEIKGCSNSIMDKNGKINGKVITIYDNQVYNYDNLLYICNSCYDKYYNYRNSHVKQLLADSKILIQNQNHLNSIINDQKIEDGIDVILKKIANVTSDEIELNYQPISVANKIYEDKFLLKQKVVMYITSYYAIIDDKIREAVVLNSFDFTSFEYKIKILFNKLDNENYSQATIFNQLVKLLKDQTNVETESCEALISYFVQKCEVFYDITE